MVDKKVKKVVKKISKWATSKPHQTMTHALSSRYNEPMPDYVRTAKPTIAGAAKMAPAGVTDIHRAGLGYIKKAAQAAGRGAAKMIYGDIKPTPSSVKPNIKPEAKAYQKRRKKNGG